MEQLVPYLAVTFFIFFKVWIILFIMRRSSKSSNNSTESMYIMSTCWLLKKNWESQMCDTHNNIIEDHSCLKSCKCTINSHIIFWIIRSILTAIYLRNLLKFWKFIQKIVPCPKIVLFVKMDIFSFTWLLLNFHVYFCIK